MAKELDVYRDWLGISETARPLNYYQLLRLKTFNDDRAKIRAHYQKMNAYVRKFATGDYGRQSQVLLNELAKAMLCLTDLQRKREYDASLGREGEVEGRRRTLEEILLAAKSIDRAQLERARGYANAVGLEVRDALVQQKIATADVVMLAYAESLGLPYVELEDVGVDEELVPRIPPTMARQHSCVPMMTDGGRLLMASPNPLVPDIEEELRLRFEMPVCTVLCTPASINAVIAEHYPRDAAAPAATVKPKKSAAKPVKPAKPKKEPSSLTPEEKSKRRRNSALIPFNLTVMAYMIYRVTTTSTLGLLDMAIAVGLGAVAAAIAVAIVMKLE